MSRSQFRIGLSQSTTDDLNRRIHRGLDLDQPLDRLRHDLGLTAPDHDEEAARMDYRVGAPDRFDFVHQ